MKKLIAKHKTTLTGVLTAVLCLAACGRWYLGQIDATELMAFVGIVNTIAITVVSAFAKDGNLKKNNDASH
jgi:hypothetical protein